MRIDQDVALAGSRRPGPCAQASRSSWVNVSPLSRVSLPRKRAMSSRTAAPDDAALGDRLDAGLVQAADRGAGVVAVPDLAVVPDVARGRRTAWSPAGRRRSCRRRSAGRRGTPGRLPPSSQSDSSRTWVRSAGVRPGHTGSPFGSPISRCRVNTLPALTSRTAAQDLLGAEVVQRADLVVVPPLAPVRGRVLEQVAEGGSGRGGVWVTGVLQGWEGNPPGSGGGGDPDYSPVWCCSQPRATFGATELRRHHRDPLRGTPWAPRRPPLPSPSSPTARRS